MLQAAESLRWSRPDLTGALARHVSEAAVAAADRDSWLVASGWRVHAAAAIGDGREAASEILESLSHWGDDALHGRAADRLRIELAILAHEAGQNGPARALLPATVADDEPELAADRALALLRCRSDDDIEDVQADLAAADAAWAQVGGRRAEIGGAATQLVGSGIERRGGQAEHAVARAVEGLARLDRGRGAPGALTPSGHLAAALAAEWISALIAADRPEQARQGTGPLRERLAENRRPTRQLALLRLTIVRATASDPRAAPRLDPMEELERAAQDAAAADAPDLEHVCRTALGELHEAAGQLESAIESIRLAVVADRRHRARAARFHTALTSTEAMWQTDPPTTDPPTAARRADVQTRPSSAPGTRAGEATPPSTPDRGDVVVAGGRVADASNGHGSAAVDRHTILRAMRSSLAAPPTDVAPTDREGPAADRAPAPGRNGSTEPRDGGSDAATADPWATGSWTGGSGTGGPHPGTAERDGAPDAVGSTAAGAQPGPSRGGGDRWGADTDAVADRAPGDGRVEAGRTGGAQPSGSPTADSSTGEALSAGPDAGQGERESVPSASNESGAAESADPDTWLAAALAELDRIWGTPGGAPPERARPLEARSLEAQPESAPPESAQPDVAEDAVAGAVAAESAGAGTVAPGAGPAHAAGPETVPPASASGETAPGGSSSSETAATGSGSTGSGSTASGRGLGASPASASSATTSPGTTTPGNGHAWTVSPHATSAWTAAMDTRSPAAAETAGSETAGSETAGFETAAAEAAGAGLPETAVAATPTTSEPDGCVVVLDLARAGERLPAAAAAATVARVAQRLADRLPPTSRLRDDGPGAVSVILPGRDRAGASEWMHRVLPGLVDGLTVDPAAAGSLLRAAVHDVDGVVGAQILQRLDGGRARGGAAAGWPAAGSVDPRRRSAPRHAAPAEDGDAEDGVGHDGVGQDGAADGGVGQVGGTGGHAAENGAAENGAALRGAERGGAVQTGAVQTGVLETGVVENRAAENRTEQRGAEWGRAAGDGAAQGGASQNGSVGHGAGQDAAGQDAAASSSAAGRARAVEPGAPVERTRAERARSAQVAEGTAGAPPAAPPRRRHDESAARPPYLPEGLIVRPGSGGRRHRRGPEPATEPDAPPSPAPQSTEGLGLADLLAGALAAYRGI